MASIPSADAYHYKTVTEAPPPRSFGTTLPEQYWRALRRHKWIAIGIIAGALFLGLIATLLTTPVYTATSRIEISRIQDKVTNVEGVQDEKAGESLEFYQTQYSLLESRSLAERVSRVLNLANNENFLTNFNISTDSDETTVRGGKSPIEARVVEELLNNISIQPIRGSSLVDIAFTSADPALSARIANSWTDQFIQSNLDRRFSSTEEARDYLEGQLESLREKLEKSEADLVAYASEKRIIALTTEQDSDGATRTDRTLASSDLEALNAALAEATAERIAAQSARDASRGVNEGSLANSAINGLRQERGQIEAEYAKLLTQFEPQYPAAQALKNQIDALDRAIAREESRVRDSVLTRYNAASAREKELRRKVEGLKSELIDQRRDSIQYAIYQREVDTNRQLYDGLLQRYKEIGVAGVGSNNVLVVDRAEQPDEPSSPILALNLAVALLIGFVVATFAVIGLELLDQSLKDPQDVERQLGIALLGSVPVIRDGDILDTLDDRKSASSEAYLSIKTNLSFMTDHGVPRSFMVTSTSANEGKSLSALALSRSLARTGASVLLIDSDMRNPSVGMLVGQRQSEGLSNYLSGQDGMESLIAETKYENLSIIDSGPIPPNAAELLSGSRMKQLITEAAARYDHVVVDCPPVLGLADAPLISSAVEGVVYTIEANRQKIRGINASIERLRAANANILGALVTKLGEHDASYGYGYGYGYDYGKSANEGRAETG